MLTDYKKLDNAAAMLKAMAHPVRIAILDLLEGEKSMSVTEIHAALGIEQAVASHHLGILRNKGVLNCRREGKNSFYSLENQLLSRIIECIEKCQQTTNS